MRVIGGWRVAVALVLACAPALVAAPAAEADEVRDRQRGMLATLDVQTAWKTTRGKGVTVAVVDTGVDPNQADLAGSVTTGPNMLASVDGNTRPARLHGTSMASLIAGHGHGPGRRDGIIGIAPEARILAIRAIGEREDPSYIAWRTSEQAEDSVARGVRYAVDQGVDVINLSLGKEEDNPDDRAAIAYAISKGVVVVSAAGNDGDKRNRLDTDGFAPYSYPASYPGVIAVAATDSSHARAPFSNRNYSVLVSAPGAGLPAAGPGGEYYLTDGTSDSSALVSGVAALIRARHPKLAPTLVAQALIAGTRYGPSGSYNPEVGFGEVNAARALNAANTLTKTRQGAAGTPAGRRFEAGEPGPVEVVPRPAWINIVIVVVIGLGVVGAVAAMGISRTLSRRHPRNALPAFAAPSPAGGGFAPAPQPRYWTPPNQNPPPARGAQPSYEPPPQQSPYERPGPPRYGQASPEPDGSQEQPWPLHPPPR